MLKEAILLWKDEQKNKNSTLHKRLVLFFLLISVSTILLFTILLMICGINGTQQDAVYNYMQNELTDVLDRVEKDSGRLSLLGISLAETISKSSEDFFDENMILASDLKNHPELIEPLLEKQLNTLLTTINNNNCSGVYILLDTTINQNAIDAKNTKSGLFLKKTLTSSNTYVNSDNYLLRGPANIARNNNIKLLGQWKMEYNIDGQDFFNEVMVNAQKNTDLPLSRLYFWTGRTVLKDNSEQGFYLLVPLRTSDGFVFGVCGLEMSDRMFKTMYCPTESTYSNVFSIVTPKSDNLLLTSKGMIAGNHYLTGHRFEYDLELKNSKDIFNWYFNEDNSYGGVSKDFRLYPSDSIYSNEIWNTAVLLPETNLKNIVKGNSDKLWFIVGGLLVISLFASYIVGKRSLKPVNDAFNSIKNTTYSQNTSNGYAEIDDLFEFLAKKDKNHAEELLTLNQQKQTEEEKHKKTKNTLSRITQNKKQEIDMENYESFIAHLHTLTPKEREIFDLYLEGKSAKEIIDQLGFTENTLKYHNKNIYSKLCVPSRKVLLQYASIMKQEGVKK